MDGQAALDLGPQVERPLVKSILLKSKTVRRKPHPPCFERNRTADKTITRCSVDVHRAGMKTRDCIVLMNVSPNALEYESARTTG